MGRRQHNPQLVKIHRTYSVEEIAALLDVHKHTVRTWLDLGLRPIDNRRPTLVDGAVLAAFLRGRRTQGRQKCSVAEIFCLRCRKPRRPAEAMVDYIAMTPSSGNLRAICPCCGGLMHRRVSLAKLREVTMGLEVAMVQAPEHIAERS